jgi:hypothetical protein
MTATAFPMNFNDRCPPLDKGTLDPWALLAGKHHKTKSPQILLHETESGFSYLSAKIRIE